MFIQIEKEEELLAVLADCSTGLLDHQAEMGNFS